MRVIEKLSSISTDLSIIGLLEHDGGYFCTPKNGTTFAGIGVDGIHFCIIPNENDLTFEKSPVYVISPMMPDHYVEIVAENFYDFISLVIKTGDAGALECVSYMTKEKFSEYLNDIEYNNSALKETLSELSSTFHGKIKDIDDVYEYVKQLQAKIDLTKIQYTDEYYELDCTNNHTLRIT